MLAGIKIISFTHFLQGPSATQILADLGADVIKVEPPKGAFERSWSAPDAYIDGTSVFFMLGNRNVRSIAVDMKSPESQQVLESLIASADVLIENFRPGAMQRLGHVHVVAVGTPHRRDGCTAVAAEARTFLIRSATVGAVVAGCHEPQCIRSGGELPASSPVARCCP